jgi:hypothetical protein
VRAFVDPAIDPGERARVSRYLRGGTPWVAAGGFSVCRVCGDANGSAELTDGTHLVWPEGLAHYVEAHNVWLPDEIVALMGAVPAPVDVDGFGEGVMVTGELVIDQSWWRSLGGEVRGR